MRRGRWLEFAAKWQRARANRVEHLPLLPRHSREPPTAGSFLFRIFSTPSPIHSHRAFFYFLSSTEETTPVTAKLRPEFSQMLGTPYVLSKSPFFAFCLFSSSSLLFFFRSKSVLVFPFPDEALRGVILEFTPKIFACNSWLCPLLNM